jgi:predicted MFS family arabinose efflux permease
MAGAGLGGLAIWLQDFSLFCLAIALLGILTGFAGFYRFAAADVANEAFRAQAVSLVVSGGIVAALVGPGLASWAKDLFPSTPFAGSLLPIVGLQILALVLLQEANISLPLATIPYGKERSLRDIMQQPVFRVAVLGSMVGYGTMVLLMSATPLALEETYEYFTGTNYTEK